MPCNISKTEMEVRKQNLIPILRKIELSKLKEEVENANQNIFQKYKVKQALTILKVAYKLFNGKLVVAFSGGKDSLVALDLALKVNPELPVVFNSTTVEFPETISYVKKLADLMGFNLHIVRPEKPFFVEVKKYGWATHENRWCCKPYKDDPAFKFIVEKKLLAEITGTTRTESIYRRSLTPFRLPTKEPFIMRINPIYDWNQQEVWRYIEKSKLPYNPVYDMGYRRIGCWCCPLNGPSHYRRLKKTHPKLYSFLLDFKPTHPRLQTF